MCGVLALEANNQIMEEEVIGFVITDIVIFINSFLQLWEILQGLTTIRIITGD